MDQYFEHLNNVAITVCDAEGNVLDMNQHSADVNSHGHKIIGNNLMDCHPEPAKTTIEKTLADGSKVKKLIYQTPWWKEDGAFGGLIEYSIEIPFEMPHFVRQPKV